MGRAKSAAFLLVVFVLFGLQPWRAQAATYRSLGIGIMSWPEEIQISNGAGRNYEANAQFYSPSIHYGYRDYRSQDGFLYEGYLLYGAADIDAGQGLTYFQRRVPMYGIGGTAGWYFRPVGKQVNFGVSIPVQYRHAKWTQPTGGYTVNKTDLFAVGAVLDLRWRLTEGLAINQRVGGFFGYKSALWMINVEWTL